MPTPPRIDSNHRTYPTWSISKDPSTSLLTMRRAWHSLLSNSCAWPARSGGFLRCLWGLADYAARTHVPVELQDLFHIDIASPSPAQAVFQRLQSLIYVQASYKILAAVLGGPDDLRQHLCPPDLACLPTKLNKALSSLTAVHPPSRFVGFCRFPSPHSYSSILLWPQAPSSSSLLLSPIPAQLS